MPLICPNCGAYALNNLERSPNSTRCSECGKTIPTNIYPLFVVTGASGSGKTAVVPELRCRLPNCVVFDKDLLWGRCGDQFYNNWLRIAYSIAQGGRYTLLSGIIMTWDFDCCEDRGLVGAIHYLNLHCSDVVREQRLRSRPAWRQCSNDWFIQEHKQVARRLLDLPTIGLTLPTIDTSETPIKEVATAIVTWVTSIVEKLPKTEPAFYSSTD